jgi:CBS domain-containing protein
VSTVRDIMDTDAPAVSPEATVEEIIRLLGDHGVPGVAVVNGGGRCVGIITESDLVLSDEEGDLHLPHYIELFGGIVYLEPLRRFEARLKKAAAATAGELMTEDPVTIGPDATAHEAGRIIADKGHNRLPVVEHGRYVGIVTRADVLGALTRGDA